MKIEILVETGESCGFKITDITKKEDNGYLPSESGFMKNRYKFEDTSVICVLGLCRSTNIFPQYEKFIYAPHNEKFNNIYIPTIFDGYFKLNYIVLPNKQWFEANKNLHAAEYIQGCYFLDQDHIYKYDKSNKNLYVEVPEKDIITILNSIDTDHPSIDLNETTLTIVRNDYVSICHLKKCFINLCKQIFDKRLFDKCAYRGKIDPQLIYNRDLVWMTINIISYLTEFGQLDEAQRIIELITSCNGICKQYYREANINGCGCS